MKNTLILPLLATCCFGFSACIFPQQCGPAEQEYDHTFAMNKQRVKDIQKAALECTSMKWEGTVSVYNQSTHCFIDEKHTYPVTGADAAAIRKLLPHLSAVRTSPREHVPGEPYMECTLLFLDADGKTILGLNHSVHGSDPDTPNICPGLSLSAADYATWESLLPADIQRRYAKASARWRRENNGGKSGSGK